MNIDAGILTGVTGAILAMISLVYARSQAHAHRHQVEEMQRQTEETGRAQHFETSHALMKDAIEARGAWAMNFRKEWAPLTIGTPLERTLALLDGNRNVLFRVGAYVEQLREMFFAQKAISWRTIIWRVMHWLVRSFFRPGNRSHDLRELCRNGLGNPGIGKVWARLFSQWYPGGSAWAPGADSGSAVDDRIRLAQLEDSSKNSPCPIYFPSIKILPGNRIARIR